MPGATAESLPGERAAASGAQEQRDFASAADEFRRWPAPWLFFLLVMPYGLMQGFVQTPLPVMLRQQGVSTGQIANIVAFVSLPSVLCVFWSPLVDFLLPRRTWMVLMAATAGALLFGSIQLTGSHVAVARWLLFLAYASAATTSACCGGLMAGTLTAAGKSKASGWFNAGLLGAAALGGGALLYFAERLSLVAVGLIAAALISLTALPAITIREAPPSNSIRAVGHSLAGMWQEVRETVFHWKAVPALLLIIAPVSTGAALPLFASFAGEYHVSSNGVALENGMACALLIMLGSLVATLLPTRWDRRISYAFAGGLTGLTGILMVLLPMHPFNYFLSVSLYSFTTGISYSCFTALVLDTMGAAGRSGSSRYTILVAFSNVACVFMTWFEGIGYNHFGAKGVPGFDAAGNMLVCAVVLAVWLFHRGAFARPARVAA